MVFRQPVDVFSSRHAMLIAKFSAFMIGASLLVAGTVRGAERADEVEAVVLVRMAFDDARWTATPLEVLPCAAPSKLNPLTKQRSTFTLTDERGKLLFRRLITNPRIILIEDPKEPAELLSKIEFTLAVPLLPGARSFQFYERERDFRASHEKVEAGPAIAVADLSAMVEKFERRRYHERASCQIIVPKPEDPEKLGPVVNTAVSAESIASLVERDQHLLIARGLELELAPKELRQLVYSYRKNWSQAGVNEDQVEQFLARYVTAYREARSKE